MKFCFFLFTRKQKQCFKNIGKTQIFTETGDTQSLYFWSNFDPFFPPKEDDQIIKKNLVGKTHPLGYPKIVKSRRISSSLQMKNRTTFYTFWAFFGKNLSEVKKLKDQNENLIWPMLESWPWGLEYTSILVPLLPHLEPFDHKCFSSYFNPDFQVSSFVAFLSTTPTFLIKVSLISQCRI